MKFSFAISPAMSESAGIQPSQSGETAKTYVFVFVPVYIPKSTVASSPSSRRNLLLKLRRIFIRQDRQLLLPFWTWFVDNPRPTSTRRS
jgi:HSP90 family molecular chaperone